MARDSARYLWVGRIILVIPKQCWEDTPALRSLRLRTHHTAASPFPRTTEWQIGQIVLKKIEDLNFLDLHE